MSDLEDLGMSLPSYPTLPPSKSEQHFQSEPPLLYNEPFSPPESVSTPKSSATSTGAAYSDVPATSTMHTNYQPSSLSPIQPEDPWQQQQQQQQPAMQFQFQRDSDIDSLPKSSPLVGYDSFAPNQSQNETTSPGSSVPIYATVKKPVINQSLQHSALHSSNCRQRTVSGSPSSFPSPGQGPTAGQSPLNDSGENLNLLTVRIRHLEQLCGKFKREKEELEENFGRQRKTFMNQMAHSDAQLSLCKNTIEKSDKDIRELSMQVLTKDEQLKDVTIAAGITEATIREQFDADRVKYEEEIASLRKIVSVQSQDTNQAMQEERERWQKEKASLCAEVEQLRKGTEGAGLTSPLEQRVKSPSPDDEEESLERSMIKAAKDTKLLRSVVVPLEEEIVSLKSKLSEADSKIADLESSRVADSSVPLIDWDTSLSSEQELSRDLKSPSRDLKSPIPSDTRELQNQLRLARAACDDLEMHTKQLNMQKNIMQEEIASLSEQLSRVRTEYEVEKLNCKELRKTWELANDHFIASQEKLKEEIHRLHQKLQRGEAVSPMRDISIDDLPQPTIIERPNRSIEDGGGEKGGAVARTHRRSWSNNETSDVLISVPNLQMKSASWSSLQKPPESDEEKLEALEKELSRVQSELKQKSDMCSNYEQQLPRVQEQLMKDLSEKEMVIDKLRAENEKVKAHVMRQQKQKETLCRQMDDLKEEMKTRIEGFQTYEREFKNQIRMLKDKFTEIKQDTQKEIAKMNEERRLVFQQLESTREEYNCLKTVQSTDVAAYQAELVSLKQEKQEIEEQLAFTTAQLNSIKDQIKNVREMLVIERGSKEKMSITLNCQLDAAKKQIDELSPLVAKLEMERSTREEAVAAKAATEKKSRDFINEQQDMIEKLNKDKDKAEAHVQELQRQVASLKHKLNHTEETQKDFVVLSQSLQVKLAQMEEEKLEQSFSAPTT